MKNFSKYIAQGIGLAVGIIIVLFVISLGMCIKSSFDVAKLEKEQQQQDIINLHKRELENMGLSYNEIEYAISNGIDLKDDGEYKVKVVSGKGDITIYDMYNRKKIKTILSVNKEKDVSFDGKSTYKVVPSEGLEIKCIKTKSH